MEKIKYYIAVVVVFGLLTITGFYSDFFTGKDFLLEEKVNNNLNSIVEESSDLGGYSIAEQEIGKGPEVKTGSTVSVRYVGLLEDTQAIFDTNLSEDKNPLVFKVGDGALIKGFELGVVGMREGGTRIIRIQPNLGYGENGNPAAGISGKDVIIFIVSIEKVVNQ